MHEIPPKSLHLSAHCLPVMLKLASGLGIYLVTAGGGAKTPGIFCLKNTAGRFIYAGLPGEFKGLFYTGFVGILNGFIYGVFAGVLIGVTVNSAVMVVTFRGCKAFGFSG